jgi:hypothetical protein
MLRPGRRIWVVVKMEGLEPFVIGPFICVSFKQLLPAGTFDKNGYILRRQKSLVQVYTDPGGYRTLAAADIRLNDPRRTGR